MGRTDDRTDWAKVDDMTLALMRLTTFQEQGVFRSWKSHDWDVLNRLHERGLINSPVSNAKSVLLTEEGRRRYEELFRRFFEL
jgi:hypothetical protein